MMWIVYNTIFIEWEAMCSPPAILPLLHLTGVHMSKSTLHWSPSLNYFMVPIVGGGGGGGGEFLPLAF